MTRNEMIAAIREADGARGALFDGKDWAAALVDSLIAVGAVRPTPDETDPSNCLIGLDIGLGLNRYRIGWQEVGQITAAITKAGYKIVKS